MERAMTVEEKIRRAEEIYERRKRSQNGESPAIPKTRNKDSKEKKDVKLLKKIIMQLIICTLIYLLFYTIQNNNYIFSEDFIKKANEVLSYDTNFKEIYDNAKKQLMIWVNNIQNKENQNTETNQNEGIGGAVEDVEQSGNEIVQEQTEQQNAETQAISQEEQDILDVKNTTTFIKPIEGIISSGYGRREEATGSVPKNHTGTDIAANLGTKIKSSTDGEVVLSSDQGDYGKHLKIQIGEVSIIYAHCNNLYVKQGDKVTQGQEIAEVGSTGNSTGPHLHFEIRVHERTVNPQDILELT